jgi:hypothetical protein
MGDPTSSYATAGIALRVSEAHKPHHHDKVETPSVGTKAIHTIKTHSNVLYATEYLGGFSLSYGFKNQIGSSVSIP